MGEKGITTWQPDTCGCIIEYSWDRDSDEATIVPTFHGHSRRCHDHEHLWNEDVYKTVLEENQRKNIVLAHAAQHTSLGEAIPQTDKRRRQSEQRQLRRDVKHNFFFTHQGEETETGPDKPRILHLTFSEQLDTKHIFMIQNRFPGLVKVH